MKSKNIIFMIFMGLILVLGLGAQAKDGWIAFGYQHAFSIESNSKNGYDVLATMNSGGLSLSVYEFPRGSQIGFFVHDSFLFPIDGTLKVNSNKNTVDYSVYDEISYLSILLGPAMRFAVANGIIAYLGVGPNLSLLTGEIDDYSYFYSIIALNIGFGLDGGMKIDLTREVAFTFGSIISIDYYNYTDVYSSVSTLSGSATNFGNYSMLGFKPYLSLAINYSRN